jgi:hypothetical protein
VSIITKASRPWNNPGSIWRRRSKKREKGRELCSKVSVLIRYTNTILIPCSYAELEEEREHHANLQRYNQELQVAVNRATEQQTTLDSELIKLRHEMMALKIDKQRQKKVLVEQKELDVPEVQKVEYLLGWKIEAVKRECSDIMRPLVLVLTSESVFLSNHNMESLHTNRPARSGEGVFYVDRLQRR